MLQIVSLESVVKRSLLVQSRLVLIWLRSRKLRDVLVLPPVGSRV